MSWTPLGSAGLPNGQVGYGSNSGEAPCAGRCTAIAIDPNDPDKTVYAAFAGGGVWRTTDAGATWTPLMDKQPCLAIGALAIDGANRRLYIGTGEDNNSATRPGVGLFIHDITAGTFTQVFNITGGGTLIDQRIGRIVVDPTNPLRLFMSGTFGLLESPDRGLNWSPVPVPGAPANGWFCDCVLDTSDAAKHRLYVAVAWTDSNNPPPSGTTPGVWARIGAGAFTLVAHTTPLGGTPTRIALAAGPKDTAATAGNDPKTLYALFAKKGGGLFTVARVDRDGASWTDRGVPSDATQSGYNLALAVDPSNRDVVLCGEARMWRSVDGGASWIKVSDPRDGNPGMHADQHALAFHPTSTSKVWAGNDGGVWLSEDGGAHFRHRNRGLQTMQYYTMSQHATYEGVLLAGAQDNGTQRAAGSAAWELVYYGDGFWTGVSRKGAWYTSYVFPDDGEVGAVYRSEKAGAAGSWDKATGGIKLSDYAKDNEPFYVPFLVEPTNAETLFLGTTKVYRTIFGGRGWKPLELSGSVFSTGNLRSQTITALTIGEQRTDQLYVGTADGRIWALDLFYMSVHQRDVPRPELTAELAAYTSKLTNLYISAIAVPRSDTTTIWVAIGMAHFWRDGVTAVPNRLFVSRDKGVTFSPVTSLTALPLANGRITTPWHFNPIHAIAIDPDDAGNVFVGTECGVFRSRNDGVTWENWSEGLPNTQVTQLLIHGNAGLVRAATFGRGAWERPINDTAGPATVDLYLRANAVDGGRRRDRRVTYDPLDPSETLAWTEGADVVIDSRSLIGLGGYEDPISTIDFSTDGAPDFLTVDRIASEHPRYSATSRVYVQAHNRGPAVAKQVKVRAFWAGKTGGKYPDLPADPFTAPDVDPSVDGAWHPLGATVEIAELRPGEPAVAKWDWKPTLQTSLTVGLLAVISNAEDQLVPATKVIAELVPKDKHVILREVSVRLPTAFYVGLVAGLVAGGLITGAVLSKKS